MNSEQLIQDLVRDARPVRRLAPVGVRWLLWVIVVALSVSLIPDILLGVRPDLAQVFHRGCSSLQVCLLTLAAIVSGWAVIALGVPGRAQNPLSRWMPVAALFAWILVIVVSGLASGMGRCGFSPGCFGSIALVGALPAAFLYFVCRRSAPLRPVWTGVLLMGAAAAAGALGTQFSCSNESPLHLLVWHVLPVIALGATGIILGRFIMGRWIHASPPADSRLTSYPPR